MDAGPVEGEGAQAVRCRRVAGVAGRGRRAQTCRRSRYHRHRVPTHRTTPVPPRSRGGPARLQLSLIKSGLPRAPFLATAEDPTEQLRLGQSRSRQILRIRSARELSRYPGSAHHCATSRRTARRSGESARTGHENWPSRSHQVKARSLQTCSRRIIGTPEGRPGTASRSGPGPRTPAPVPLRTSRADARSTAPPRIAAAGGPLAERVSGRMAYRDGPEVELVDRCDLTVLARSSSLPSDRRHRVAASV